MNIGRISVEHGFLMFLVFSIFLPVSEVQEASLLSSFVVSPFSVRVCVLVHSLKVAWLGQERQRRSTLRRHAVDAGAALAWCIAVAS